MLCALVLVCAAVICGALLSHLFDRGAALASHLCAGIVIGFAVFSFLGFIAVLVASFSWILLPATAVVCSFVLFIFSRLKSENSGGSDRVRFLQRRHAFAVGQARVMLSDCVFYLLIGLLLCFAFNRVMFLRPDGVYTGFSNNLGDLPFHL